MLENLLRPQCSISIDFRSSVSTLTWSCSRRPARRRSARPWRTRWWSTTICSNLSNSSDCGSKMSWSSRSHQMLQDVRWQHLSRMKDVLLCSITPSFELSKTWPSRCIWWSLDEELDRIIKSAVTCCRLNVRCPSKQFFDCVSCAFKFLIVGNSFIRVCWFLAEPEIFMNCFNALKSNKSYLKTFNDFFNCSQACVTMSFEGHGEAA